ncbi:hypothetical protein BTS2_3698 [Bacillus sp. TS-2]|nr:hypothetical protein BTS2_3698 [Bacillus sp. TS-2]
MAFGITKKQLSEWKQNVNKGEISFLTHYWYDERFPGCKTVTKVGCINVEQLMEWGKQYELHPNWIDKRGHFPHFDLLGEKQYQVLQAENKLEQLERLNLKKSSGGYNLYVSKSRENHGGFTFES